jgi:thiosulfate/3-mercaptopyruvate sulfurtransferase
MDLLSNMLTTLRLDASIFLHASFCQEWAIDISAIDIGTFHLIAHGGCWLHRPNAEPIALCENDLLVLPHNAPHLVSPSPEPPKDSAPRNTPAEEIVGPSVTLICGTVAFSQSYWNPLVEALPEYVIMRHAEYRDTTLGKAIEALISECERNESGSEVVIDRLADILFIEVLRGYVNRAHGNSFMKAISDSRISKALAGFHDEPGGNWNVQNLADTASMSRSAFAERFQNLVGMSPMNYVTRWRMQYAHARITETTDAIGEIAADCGYQNEESFARAFRKEFGISPQAARRRETINDIAGLVSVRGDDIAAAKVTYEPVEVNRLRLSDSVVLVDVRDAEDYARGHIPGAVNISEMFYALSFTTPDGILDMQKKLLPLLRRAGISRDKKVIVYEDNLDTRYGGSCRGYFQLSFFGHPDCGILDGGLEQWIAEGYPVTTEKTRRSPSSFEPSVARQVMATVDDVIVALDHPDIKLLDNRDKSEWLGITSAPTDFYDADFLPRKGRIPGARWIEWHQFMEEKGSISHFKSPEQIRAICAQAGLYPDDNIIIYCFKGARSSNSWVALKLAGFKHVRNYYGSWNEWARNGALPAMSVQLVG